MKLIFTFLLALTYLAANDPINNIEKIIVCPNFIIFKSNMEDDHWTVQTLSRNFDVYKLSVSGPKDSTSVLHPKEVDYYSNPEVKFYFSKWRSGLEPVELQMSDVTSFDIENEWGIKEKVAMIAYLNRKNYPFIEKFFSTSFRVGTRTIATTLEKPVNVIDYKKSEFLFYQDLNTVYAIFPHAQYNVLKTNYSWTYRNQKIVLRPTLNYVKTKPISAISAKERKWYNIQWEKMYKANKINATLTSSGITWQTSGLDEKEKNLVLWFKKR